MTTPDDAEPDVATAPPTDPDMLYMQAQRVRALQFSRDEAFTRAVEARQAFDKIDRELEVAQMSLRQLLDNVDPGQCAPWALA